MQKLNVIAPLTSLRFVFALFVFLSHLDYLAGEENTVLAWLYKRVFFEGYIGVSFFFMLSGFVLALNYKRRLANYEIGFRTFFVARIARIYPMHLVTLLIAIPLTLVSLKVNAEWILHLVTNGLLLHSFIPYPDFYFSFNKVSWSICNEMFFYVLFPVIILAIKHFGKSVLWLVFCFLIITNLLLPFLLSEEVYRSFIYISPFVRIVDFIIGIVLYEIYLKLNTKLNFSLLEVLSVLLFIAFFWLHEYVPQCFRYSMYYWLPIGLILLVFSFQKGIVSRFLSNKKMMYLGEISFSFYLLHLLIMQYLDVLHRKFFGGEKGWYFALLALIITVMISAMCYRWIEQPLGKCVKKMLGKSQ